MISDIIPSNRKKVLLLFAHYDELHHKGIMKFAREANWIVFTGLFPIGLNQQKFDGIISRHHNHPKILEQIHQFNLPTVDLYYGKTEYPLVRITHDEEEIGSMGASHLIEKGYKNLVYVKFLNTPGDLGRMRGFAQKCETQGKNYRTIEIKELPDFLKTEKYPLGIMVGDDSRAIYLCGLCEELGYSIPDQIGVLGADNDSSELCQVPLSSVDNDVEGIGYKAAQILSEMMETGKKQSKSLKFSPKKVIGRKSTDLLGITDLKVAKAVRFMQENLQRSISLEQIAEASEISRRRLDDHFKRTFQISMSKYLLKLRLEKAVNLLKTTKKPLQQIAVETGLNCAENLIRIVKREKGCSPSYWRSEQK